MLERLDKFEKSDKVFRLNALYHRRDSTEWSDKEKRAFNKLSKRPDFFDEISRIEQYFAAMKADARHQFLRHDLITLLNNWTGELDRAENFQPQNVNVSKHLLSWKHDLRIMQQEDRAGYIERIEKEHGPQPALRDWAGKSKMI